MRDIRDLGEINRQQEHMRDIDLPRTFENACGGNDETVLLHGTAIDESCRVARDEDEYLRRVTEAVIAYGDPADRVGWNVVKKDQPKRDATEQIKPEIAFGRNRGHVRLFFRAVFKS